MTKLTGLAAENVDLLHQIEAYPHPTIASLAQAIDRDPANVRKTLLRLREESLVDPDKLLLSAQGQTVTRLLAPDGEVLADDATLLLRHDQIELDPANARTDIDPFAINALAADILARSRPGRVGLLHALTVLPPATPHGLWRLRGGERRWRAIRNLIDLEELPEDAPIPCVRHDGLSDLDAALMALVENVQRVDLHPLDEGAGYTRLVNEFGLDEGAIAEAVKKSKKHVQDRIALVEKLDDEAKRRMRLDPGHDDHLTYAAARRLMQAQNPRPKPPVDVTPKEALVLLEVVDRVRRHPAPDAGAYTGKKGWTAIEAIPAGGAASSLVGKGLIEFVEPPYGKGAFVRLDEAKAAEVRRWIAEKGAMGLWHARAEVLDSGIAAELERTRRYATPWLNDPLPAEPEIPEPRSALAAPAAAPSSPTEARPSPPAPDTGAREESTDEALSPALLRLAGAEPRSAPPPAEDAYPELTDVERRILLDVAAKTLSQPVPGRVDPATGKPAFVGCEVGAFHKDAAALRLVHVKMLRFIPSARNAMIASLSPLGEAWILEHGAGDPPTPPYATPWLNPPEPEAPAAASAPTPGELSPQATEGASGAKTYLAKPVFAAPWEFTCGNCCEDFEISETIEPEDIDGGPRSVEAIRFTPQLRVAECPNCKAPIRLLAAEIYLVETPERKIA